MVDIDKELLIIRKLNELKNLLFSESERNTIQSLLDLRDNEYFNFHSNFSVTQIGRAQVVIHKTFNQLIWELQITDKVNEITWYWQSRNFLFINYKNEYNVLISLHLKRIYGEKSKLKNEFSKLLFIHTEETIKNILIKHFKL